MLTTVFEDLPIKRKLYAAFAVLGALAAVILAFSIYELTSMGNRFKSFEDLSGDALLASEMNADMAKLQLNARQYLTTRSQEDLTQIRSFQGQFEDNLVIARDEINKTERKERVGQIDAGIGTYNTGISELISLMEQQDKGFHTA